MIVTWLAGARTAEQVAVVFDDPHRRSARLLPGGYPRPLHDCRGQLAIFGWWCEMTLYLTVRVVLNTAAYDAEVDFWIGSMGARRVGAWDRGLDDRGVLLELRPATVIEVIDQAAQNTGATAVGTVLACQVVSPEVVDDRYQSIVTDLGTDAVLTPLGDRAWGHRSFSVRSPGGAEVVVYADQPP
jgi:catechol 2,3-dioxygenase-like lactoylglutathione lyase family enzyme